MRSERGRGEPAGLIEYLGIAVAVLGLIYTLGVVLDKIFFPNATEAWISLMVVVLLMGGAQVITMGSHWRACLA